MNTCDRSNQPLRNDETNIYNWLDMNIRVDMSTFGFARLRDKTLIARRFLKPF
jgi:hypothetical protein